MTGVQSALDHLADVVRVALGVPLARVALTGDEPLPVDGARAETALPEALVVDGSPVVAFAGCPVCHDEGARLGSVSAMDTLPREWTPADLELLRNCAAVAGELLQERARELEEIATMLQMSLRPHTLPRIDGIELAVSFRPFGEQTIVGGDFYDVFACPTGHLIVLGDVCGKGVEAATIGGAVRSALRGAGSQTDDVEALLRLANDEVLRQPTDLFLTLLIAHVGPPLDGRRRVSVGSAGHEPPVILRAGGRVDELPARGQLAGIFARPQFEIATAGLAPGDAMVFWTDGLTEIGIRLGGSDINVTNVLDTVTPASAGEIVTVLEDRAGLLDTDTPAPPDDIAIIALRLNDTAGQAARATAPPGEAPADTDDISLVEERFRRLNEAVEDGRPPESRHLGLLCECGHPACRQTIDVPRRAYERLRDLSHAYVIVPGHQVPRAEDVIERHVAFWVVRKHGG